MHVAASLAVAASGDLLQFFVARVFQGFGAAAAAVVAMAMVRDLFSGYSMVRALSLVALVSGFAPLIAPVVGSQILAFADWHGIFVFLAGYALLMLLCCLLLADSLPRDTRSAGTRVSWLARYRRMLSDRSFIGLMVMGGMRFTALFAYLQASPFLLQRELGLTPQEYGVTFAVITLGMMTGVQSSSRLARFIPVRAILLSSLGCVAAAGVLVAVSAPLGWGVGAVIVVFVLFMVGCGLGLPMIQSLALLDHPDEAGTAAALIGASSFGAAALFSPLVGLTTTAGLGEAVGLGVVFLLTSVVGAIALFALVGPTRSFARR